MIEPCLCFAVICVESWSFLFFYVFELASKNLLSCHVRKVPIFLQIKINVIKATIIVLFFLKKKKNSRAHEMRGQAQRIEYNNLA